MDDETIKSQHANDSKLFTEGRREHDLELYLSPVTRDGNTILDNKHFEAKDKDIVKTEVVSLKQREDSVDDPSATQMKSLSIHDNERNNNVC